MSNWEISKEIGFDYGHRVHNQTLNKEFSVDDDCVCKHLHGHRGMIQVFLSGNELERGMVTDFKHLNWFQKFIDDNIDHKFILDTNDPWFPSICNLHVDHYEDGGIVFKPTMTLNTSEAHTLAANPIYVPGTDLLTGWALDVSDLSGPEREFYEGFFFVNFVPTSENLCKWAYDITSAKMKKIDVKVSKVLWQETPKSRAVYSGD